MVAFFSTPYSEPKSPPSPPVLWIELGASPAPTETSEDMHDGAPDYCIGSPVPATEKQMPVAHPARVRGEASVGDAQTLPNTLGVWQNDLHGLDSVGSLASAHPHRTSPSNPDHIITIPQFDTKNSSNDLAYTAFTASYPEATLCHKREPSIDRLGAPARHDGPSPDDHSSVPSGVARLAVRPLDASSKNNMPEPSPSDGVLSAIPSRSTFLDVPRIDAASVSDREIVRQVHALAVEQGVPVVVENWHKRVGFSKDILSLEWLRQNVGHTEIEVRDSTNNEDVKMRLAAYLDHLELAVSRNSSMPVMYGKDILSPKQWHEAMTGLLPAYFHYQGTNDHMSELPRIKRAFNLMIYIGYGGTTTPAHKDMCYALGHNLMVEADEGASATWYMVARKYADEIDQLFVENGQNVYHESFVVPEELFLSAPFPVYRTEQRVGDFVLVPSQCLHQVKNSGGRTTKIAWNRVTTDSLIMGIRHCLSRYQAVCRPETYRLRTVLLSTITNWTYTFSHDESVVPDDLADLRNERDEFRRLIALFRDVVQEELIPADLWSRRDRLKQCTGVCYSCDYCRCDLFNRFFRCTECTTSVEPCYDICLSCYVRNKGCPHAMVFYRQIKVKGLMRIYDDAVSAYHKRWGAKEKFGVLAFPTDVNATAAAAYIKWQQLRSQTLWSGEEVDTDARLQGFHVPPDELYAPPELPVTRRERSEERAAARRENEIKRKRQQAGNGKHAGDTDDRQRGKRREHETTKTSRAKDRKQDRAHQDEDAASPPEPRKRKIVRDVKTRPCSRCRRIKQKCDRIDPCARCVRAGAACDVAEMNADNQTWLVGHQAATQDTCLNGLPS